jgi:hypothetical protein
LAAAARNAAGKDKENGRNNQANQNNNNMQMPKVMLDGKYPLLPFTFMLVLTPIPNVQPSPIPNALSTIGICQ